MTFYKEGNGKKSLGETIINVIEHNIYFKLHWIASTNYSLGIYIKIKYICMPILFDSPDSFIEKTRIITFPWENAVGSWMKRYIYSEFRFSRTFFAKESPSAIIYF